jgi:hypothetical protein
MPQNYYLINIYKINSKEILTPHFLLFSEVYVAPIKQQMGPTWFSLTHIRFIQLLECV